MPQRRRHEVRQHPEAHAPEAEEGAVQHDVQSRRQPCQAVKDNRRGQEEHRQERHRDELWKSVV